MSAPAPTHPSQPNLNPYPVLFDSIAMFNIVNINRVFECVCECGLCF